MGPAEPTTLRALLETCADLAGTPSRLVPVDLATLKERGIEGWTDLPVWAPPNDGNDGVARVDRSRAIALGMRYRSLETTVADTLRWAQSERGDAPLKAGLTPEREAELLALAAR